VSRAFVLGWNLHNEQKRRFDDLAGTMTSVLQATRGARRAEVPAEAVVALADRAAALLKRLVARASAVTNIDDADSGALTSPQTVVDGPMKGLDRY
jgi:hypothetical protein